MYSKHITSVLVRRSYHFKNTYKAFKVFSFVPLNVEQQPGCIFCDCPLTHQTHLLFCNVHTMQAISHQRAGYPWKLHLHLCYHLKEVRIVALPFICVRWDKKNMLQLSDLMAVCVQQSQQSPTSCLHYEMKMKTKIKSIKIVPLI